MKRTFNAETETRHLGQVFHETALLALNPKGNSFELGTKRRLGGVYVWHDPEFKPIYGFVPVSVYASVSFCHTAANKLRRQFGKRACKGSNQLARQELRCSAMENTNHKPLELTQSGSFSFEEMGLRN